MDITLHLLDQNGKSYKKQRLLAINNELKAIANCDNISFSDLIKNVYSITPTDKNYELF